MRVLAVVHPSFQLHRGNNWHPERPDRFLAAQEGLSLAPVETIELVSPKVQFEVLEGVHTETYIGAIEQFCAAGGGDLDPDTYAVPETWEAALRAAGAGPAAVSAMERGAAEAAFCIVRPPGHHALENRAMGFCIFNNIAVTARYLTGRGERVAIVDWDVHHGNGTQDMFVADGSILYVSLHQFPFYPGSGWLEEVGYGPGAGRTVNIALPARSAGDVYREAFRRVVLPVVRQFAPGWLLVSAGYDAHRDDELADMRLVESDYAYMANALSGIVDEGRTILFLEGGYDLRAIRDSVTATFAGLAGEIDPSSMESGTSDTPAWRSLELLERTVAEYWEVR
jgi:acetoin utilization deacetylase AcuC-like enzyme